MSEIMHSAQAEPPGAKSCTLLSQMVFLFFYVILMGVNRSGSNKSKGADQARCGEYGKKEDGIEILLGLTAILFVVIQFYNVTCDAMF